MAQPEPSAHPVLQAEAERARALCAHDVAALATVLHPDLRHVHATGVVHDRAGYLAYVANGPRFESVQLSQPRLFDWGETVLLTGGMRLHFTRPGESVSQTARSWVSLVWHREPAGWQLVSLQSTRADAP